MYDDFFLNYVSKKITFMFKFYLIYGLRIRFDSKLQTLKCYTINEEYCMSSVVHMKR